MFKKLAISLGVASFAAMVIYTVRVHRDNQDITLAAEDMIELFSKHMTDQEFAQIVEGLGDIDN